MEGVPAAVGVEDAELQDEVPLAGGEAAELRVVVVADVVPRAEAAVVAVEGVVAAESCVAVRPVSAAQRCCAAEPAVPGVRCYCC